MTTTATRANSPAQWEETRFGDAMPDPAPTYPHRIGTLLAVLNFCLRQTPGPAASILDLGAGTGQVGRFARLSHDKGTFPPFLYHATEQTEKLARFLKTQVAGASVAEWSYGASASSDMLTETLERAADSFLREYSVVLLSHLLEHVSDYYGLLDEAWRFVQPGGFLVVCVPRNDEHRTHYTVWDWNRLLAVLRQYAGEGVPIGCWECGSWADLFCAVPKPGGRPAQVQGGPLQMKAHVDERIQGSFPTALDTEAHTRRPPPGVNGRVP